MPILDVELVLSVGEVPRDDPALRLADAAGTAPGSDPGSTWVKLHYLPRQQDGENAGVADADAIAPVFVSLLMADPPAVGDAQRAQVTAALTDAIANTTQRARDPVHILLEPAARGRIAFGGNLRE